MRIKLENFPDYMARLFPEEHNNVKSIELGHHLTLARTVTFQVTDACNLCCTYCLVQGSKILMSDFTYKNIEDIKDGDVIIGFDENPIINKQRKLIFSKVTHVFNPRESETKKIYLESGKNIECSLEHPFLNNRNQWVEADKIKVGDLIRTIDYDTHNLQKSDINSIDYKIGYVISCFLGDGCMYSKPRKECKDSNFYKNRLAVKDIEIINRCEKYLNDLGFSFYKKKFLVSKKYNISNDALFSNDKDNYLKLQTLISDNFGQNKTYDYFCGFLAGIIDTEGTVTKNYVRIFNSDNAIINECISAFNLLKINFCFDKDKKSKNKICKTIRTKNDKENLLSLLLIIQNAVIRKSYNVYKDKAVNGFNDKVIKIENNLNQIVYNFETECHTYIANDIMTHNCYQINKHHNMMEFDTAKRFIDLLLDADEESNEYINPKNSPAIIIEFIGGEPFLNIDLIDKITDYFTQQMIIKHHKWATRYMISICSNGVLYFEPKVQEYIKKHLHHLSFSISIDGNKKLHDACRVFPDGSGSYDIAIKGVKHFMEVLGGKMGSKMTLAPSNIQYAFDAVKNLIELNYGQIMLNCVYEKGWTNEHAKIFYNQLKQISDYLLENNLEDEIYMSIFEEDYFHQKDESDLNNWCGGNGDMISVDWRGDIYPCIRYMESSLGSDIKPLKIGDVYNGIMATKEQCDCVHCLRCIDRKTQSTDECFNCPIAEGCSWCTAYNYQEFGTPNHRATYICCMHKARALANAYFWNKTYIKRGENKVFHNNVPKEWALEIISQEELDMINNLEKR